MKLKIALAAASILLFTCLLAYRGYIHFGQQVEIVKHDVKYLQDTTTHWKDEFNKEHAKNISLQEDYSTAKILYDKDIKAAAKEIKVNQSQIEGLQHLVAEYKNTIKAKIDTTRRGDTTSSFTHVDQFSKIHGAAVGDSEVVSYQINVPVDLRPYWQRPKEFLGIRYGKIEHYIDASSLNPNVHLDSLKDIRIIQKDSGRFGIGPSVGVFTDLKTVNWGIGITLTYSLIRF